MVVFLQPLPIGDAVRVLLAPPAGAELSRVLRKTADTFTGEEDPDAAVVYEGDDRYFVDRQTLTNGTAYYYKAYHRVADVWTGTATQTATPAATAGSRGPDPLVVVRERLEAGLRAEVAAGRLAHDNGYIPCFTAPPTYENIQWPVVTVHLRNDAPGFRGLGEDVAGDVYDADENEWVSSEGWISRFQIELGGWTLNSDERLALRAAIKKVLIGNLPVFKDAGMDELEFTQTDVEDFESYNAPVYQTITSLTCLAPFVVDAAEPAISDVTVQALAA